MFAYIVRSGRGLPQSPRRRRHVSLPDSAFISEFRPSRMCPDRAGQSSARTVPGRINPRRGEPKPRAGSRLSTSRGAARTTGDLPRRARKRDHRVSSAGRDGVSNQARDSRDDRARGGRSIGSDAWRGWIGGASMTASTGFWPGECRDFDVEHQSSTRTGWTIADTGGTAGLPEHDGPEQGSFRRGRASSETVSSRERSSSRAMLARRDSVSTSWPQPARAVAGAERTQPRSTMNAPASDRNALAREDGCIFTREIG